jgi:hypothetical protein
MIPFRLALFVAALISTPAQGTMPLPIDEEVELEVQGWRISCLGYRPRFHACSASRKVGIAKLELSAWEKEFRIELQGGCAKRMIKAERVLQRPFERYEGQVISAIDTMFINQFEGCRSPHSWELFKTADQAAYIMYQLTRRD